MPVLLSFGHGYSARRLAAHLRREGGWRVRGTTRSEETAAAIRAEGDEALPFPPPAEALAEATHLLSSIPPGPEGDPVLAALGPAIRAGRFEWIGLLSTTGVYGDRGGGWVDEESELRPSSPRAAARVAQSAAWLALAPAQPVQVFRLAGIYGPGRGPFGRLRSGEARRIVKPGQVFSRIHADDIAAALRASMARPDPGRVYNLCDDLAAPPEAVLEGAARLLGLAPPPEVAFEEAGLSPMARSFYADCRRVANRRMREELGVELRHPTWREGLAAILAEEEGRGA